MSEMKCFQIELTKGYGNNEFREDLKKLYFRLDKAARALRGHARSTTRKVVSLPLHRLADRPVESFLEDINNILNSARCPTSLPTTSGRRSSTACARSQGARHPRDQGRLKQLRLARAREPAHRARMSPVGDAFRVRCRMFPSLINCCTIDWYDRWPVEALQSVSQQFFEPLEFGDDRRAGDAMLDGRYV